MLVPDKLTVKMTVKVCEAAASALRINSLKNAAQDVGPAKNFAS
jgi:hypothetical protein